MSIALISNVSRQSIIFPSRVSMRYLNMVDFGDEIGIFKEVTLTITGEVAGTLFKGSDTVKVIIQLTSI